MRIFLISNMYPSKKDHLFGIFVRNSKQELEKQGLIFSTEVLIRGKAQGKLKKAYNYLKHYLRSVWFSFRKNYDLIYVHFLSHHLPVLLFLLIGKRAPLVVNMHGSDIIGLLKFRRLKNLAAYVLLRLDLLVVPTPFYKELLLREFLGLQKDRIFISPSGGIDRSLFYPLKEKPIGDGSLLVGFVSRLTIKKGWKIFLEALKLLRDEGISARGIIAGKGPDAPAIQAYINELGLSDYIDFLGFVPQKELPKVYNRLDLYVFPTLIETESLGLTGLEAMSCGLPVIASDIAGPTTYIQEGLNGYLVCPGNSAILASKIKEFLFLSPRERRTLSENALKTAQTYDRVRVAAKLKDRLIGVCSR